MNLTVIRRNHYSRLKDIFYITYLQAASFGKSFLENYPSSKLIEMSRYIRILNTVRSHHIGIPITIQQ